MKSIKLKVFFLAASFFALSATFAQDTTNKPTPDTSKAPKPDTTSMKAADKDNSVVNKDAQAINSSLTKAEDKKVEAKKEETTK